MRATAAVENWRSHSPAKASRGTGSELLRRGSSGSLVTGWIMPSALLNTVWISNTTCHGSASKLLLSRRRASPGAIELAEYWKPRKGSNGPPASGAKSALSHLHPARQPLLGCALPPRASYRRCTRTRVRQRGAPARLARARSAREGCGARRAEPARDVERVVG